METELSYLFVFVVLMSVLVWIGGNWRAMPPLYERDLVDLYRTNITLSPEEEVELTQRLPNPKEVLTPEDFDHIVKERELLAGLDREFRSDLWDCSPTEAGLEELEALADQLARAVEPLASSQAWKLAAIAAGRSGGPSREPWDNLLSMIEAVCNEAATAQETLIRYAPTLSDKMPLKEQECVVQEVLRHLEGGRKLGPLTLLTHLSWKRFIHETRVGAGQPRIAEHFRAMEVLICLQISRHELAGRWDRQVVALGAPPSSEFGDELGRACAQFSLAIRHCLEWYGNVWDPLERNLKSMGFHWDAFLGEQPPNFAPYGELVRLRDAAISAIAQVLSARSNAIRWRRLQSGLEGLTRTLACASSDHTSSQVVSRMQEAVSNLDSAAYREAFEHYATRPLRNPEVLPQRQSVRLIAT